MEQQFPLLGGRGTLSLRTEGPRVSCAVALSDDGRGLYKAYLSGGGARYLLGTLVPERGALRLRRTVTRDALERSHVWPPDGAVAELSFAFGAHPKPAPPPQGWTREPHPAQHLGDAVLLRAAQTLSGGLLRKQSTGFQLAFPYLPGQAFALTPLFCFAQYAQLEGEGYLVFSFDESGTPVFTAAPSLC